MRDESWIDYSWRPFMAWSYGTICLWDFMLADIYYSQLTVWLSIPLVEWQPKTLAQGAIYHAAMGAIVSVTSWSRGQEKLAKISESK